MAKTTITPLSPRADSHYSVGSELEQVRGHIAGIASAFDEFHAHILGLDDDQGWLYEVLTEALGTEASKLEALAVRVYELDGKKAVA